MSKIETISKEEYERFLRADASEVNNEILGKIDQYEIVNLCPDSFVGYIGDRNHDGMGVDRLAGETWKVTTWMGNLVGNATVTGSWPVNSYIGSRMYSYHAIVNGREYYGRGFGKGMSVVFRETAKSKRMRASK